MALAAGQIVAKNTYITVASTVVAMCYAGQAPTTVQTYVAEQHALIQAQLIASGLVTVSVVGVTAGAATIPAVGAIS